MLLVLQRWILLFIHLTFNVVTSPWHHGKASTFDDPKRDKSNVGWFACDTPVRREGRSEIARQLFDQRMVVAHPNAPCWSVWLMCLPSTRNCAFFTVADRGPLHADIDLWSVLAKTLGSQGMDKAYWVSADAVPPVLSRHAILPRPTKAETVKRGVARVIQPLAEILKGLPFMEAEAEADEPDDAEEVFGE